MRNGKRLPNLKHIVTFVEVVKAKGFSRAAEALHMTQPGVTAHIHKLEEGLGYKLLERYAGKILLTTTGQDFYRFCLNLIGQMDDALSNLEDQEVQVRGVLRLAAPGSVAGFLLQHVARMRLLHPQLCVSLQFQPNEVILRDLGDGVLDVGFVTEPVRESQFRSELLMSEEVAIIGSRASGRRRMDTPEGLYRSPFVDYPDSPHLLQKWFTHHFKGTTLDLSAMSIHFIVNNLEAVIRLVAGGHGRAIVPLASIVDHPLRKRLQVVHGPKASAMRQPVFWTVRRNQYLSRNVIALHKYLYAQMDSVARV